MFYVILDRAATAFSPRLHPGSRRSLAPAPGTIGAGKRVPVGASRSQSGPFSVHRAPAFGGAGITRTNGLPPGPTGPLRNCTGIALKPLPDPSIRPLQLRRARSVNSPFHPGPIRRAPVARCSRLRPPNQYR